MVLYLNHVRRTRACSSCFKHAVGCLPERDMLEVIIATTVVGSARPVVMVITYSKKSDNQIVIRLDRQDTAYKYRRLLQIKEHQKRIVDRHP